MRPSSVFGGLLLGLSLVACAGAEKEAESPTASKSTAAAPPPSAEPQKITSLRRSQVKETISQGLGVFLQNVSVEDYPVMRDGRFVGFKLRALNPEWGIDLKPGDVILKVNGLPIEHPEDADAALRSLEKAPGLKVDFEREGKARTLELPITND